MMGTVDFKRRVYMDNAAVEGQRCVHLLDFKSGSGWFGNSVHTTANLKSICDFSVRSTISNYPRLIHRAKVFDFVSNGLPIKTSQLGFSNLFLLPFQKPERTILGKMNSEQSSSSVLSCVSFLHRPSVKSEFTLDPVCYGIHHSRCRHAASHNYHAVVHIPGEAQPPCFQFLIKLYDPLISVVEVFQYLHNRLLCPSSGAESVAVLTECRLKDGHKHLRHCLLDCSVDHCGNSKLAYSSVRFWDFPPLHRLRFVCPCLD